MKSILHRLGITALVSAVEDVGLVVWLTILHTNPIVTGMAIAATVLFTYLTVEHLISQQDSADTLTKRSIGRVAGFSAIEVVNWAIWLALIPINPALAAIYFVASFFIEHRITLNVKRGLPFFSLRGNGTKGIIVETVSEFIGAALWLMLGPIAGVIALVTGSSIEHFVASGQ